MEILDRVLFWTKLNWSYLEMGDGFTFKAGVEAPKSAADDIYSIN